MGDCMRIFNDLKKRLDNIGMNFLGDFTVEQKETWPPLMAADLLAATYSMVSAGDLAGTLPSGAMKPAKTLKGALAFLKSAPNALSDLKAEYVRFGELEIEEWRKRRDARRKAVGPRESN